jgi:molybdate transport system substrate-binding protein
MKWLAGVVLASAATGAAAQASDATALTVHAAGSLRAALTRIAEDYAAAPGGQKVNLVFGASGLLRDRLLGGERSDVFASANMEHPQALAAAGKAEPVQAFARNALCALAAPGFALKGRTLAQRLLDADVKVGISTPKADPSGDYAFEMFERIESTGAAPAGAAERLKAKALQLTGGPNSPPPPPDRNVYGVLMAEGKADLFITYCTNARLVQQEAAAPQVLPIPEAINVSARYGMAVVQPASAPARRFVDFVLSAAGQQRLAAVGFSAP